MSEDEKTLNLSVEPNLEYKYRDIFNLHIGTEDVVIEFGNIHRGQEGEGCINDRIVLSPANAMRLQQVLTQSLSQMQQHMQDMAKKQAENDVSNN